MYIQMCVFTEPSLYASTYYLTVITLGIVVVNLVFDIRMYLNRMIHSRRSNPRLVTTTRPLQRPRATDALT